jgi:hypothetical protein
VPVEEFLQRGALGGRDGDAHLGIAPELDPEQSRGDDRQAQDGLAVVFPQPLKTTRDHGRVAANISIPPSRTRVPAMDSLSAEAPNTNMPKDQAYKNHGEIPYRASLA